MTNKQLLKPKTADRRPSGIRNLIRMTELGVLSVAMVLFYSCKGDDPIPEKPVETNDTLRISIASVANAKNNISVIENADAKKTYEINFKNDFPANANEIGADLKKFGQAVNALPKKVVNINGNGIYPESETDNIITYKNYADLMLKLNLKSNPQTGIEYLAATPQDSIDFKNAGHNLRVLRGEYGDAAPVMVNNESQLVEKVAEAKSLLADNKKVAFVMTNRFDFNNQTYELLKKEIMANPNVIIYAEKANVAAGMDSVRVDNPREFANAFPNTEKAVLGSGKYFFVPGNSDGKGEFVNKVGFARTDTLNVTNIGLLEKGLIPNTLYLDKDLYNLHNFSNGATIKKLAQYEKSIKVIGLENQAAPGGKNRIYNLNPGLYNIESTLKSGEDRRIFYLVGSQVIGPYCKIGESKNLPQAYYDIANDIVGLQDVFEYNSGYGNYLVQKMIKSNEAAGEGLMPLLDRYTGELPVYILTYSNEEPFNWNVPATWQPIPNNYALVKLETLRYGFKNAFGLDLENAKGGNNLGRFSVSPKNLNPVVPDDKYNEALNSPEGLVSIYTKYIYTFGKVRETNGVFIQLSIVNKYNRGIH